MRLRHWIAPSRGPKSIGKREAERERDQFLQQHFAAKAPSPEPPPAAVPDVLTFGDLAETWRRDFVENRIGGRYLIAASTRQKYLDHLKNHILPLEGHALTASAPGRVSPGSARSAASWYMMADLRNIMSGIFTKAQDWEILPDTYANPIRRVKLPRKWRVRESRILTEQETIAVLAGLKDPFRLIVASLISTGTRISELLALQWKHVDLDNGSITICQRNWHGDIDAPKTQAGHRTLALGSLVDEYRARRGAAPPDAWVFPQPDCPRRPMWDSTVRYAIHTSAKAVGCDFKGLGPHSFRRINITWRQEAGASAIEAAQIAGHSTVRQTYDYTRTQLKRQEETTRAIQERLVSGGIDAPDATAPVLN